MSAQLFPHWAFEPTHCHVRFSVSHFGISETQGQFRTFEGSIQLADPAEHDRFEDAAVRFQVEVASIDTEEAQRDAHLRSPDFFDAAQYPYMHFESTGFRSQNGKDYVLEGNLTIRGVTQPVAFQVRYNGIVEKDPFGFRKAGFRLTGTIDRKAYGITWNRTLDFGGIAVGNEVDIVCHIELVFVTEAVAAA